MCLGLRLISGGAAPVSPVLLDALLQVERLIVGWGEWVRDRFRLPAVARLEVPEVFDLLHARFDDLLQVFEVRALLRDFGQACVELERVFPVEAPTVYRHRTCPLCLSEVLFAGGR